MPPACTKVIRAGNAHKTHSKSFITSKFIKICVNTQEIKFPITIMTVCDDIQRAVQFIDYRVYSIFLFFRNMLRS